MPTFFRSSVLPFLRQDLENSPEHNRNWYANRVIRLLIWLAFVVICIVFVFLPQQNIGQQVDEFSARSIAAANQGLPFFYTYPRDPGFISFNQLPYHEVGVHILNALAYVVGRTFAGNSFQLPVDASVYLVLGLMIFTSLLFVSPTVPILISLGGNIALVAALFTGAIDLWLISARWGATYGAILTGMMLATAFTVGVKRRPHIFAHILLLGILAGLTKYLREESAILVYGAFLLVVISVAIIELVRAIAQRRAKRDGLVKHSAILQPLVYCFIFVAVVYSSQFFVRGLYALAWKVPYAATSDSFHGSGHAMLLSLGYVDNPYNLGWADDLGPAETEMRLPGSANLRRFDKTTVVYNQLFEPAYQARAGSLAWSIMLQNPSLVLKNIITKFSDLLQWLFPENARYPFQGQIGGIYINFSPLILLLAFGTVVLLLISAWYIYSIQAWILGITGIGLIALSLISPLLIHPFYISALRGVLYSCAFVLLGACFTLWLQRDTSQPNPVRPLILKSTAVLGGFVVLVLVMAVSIFVVLNNRYQDQLRTIATSDPAAQLTSKTYQFADAFNALDLAVQEQLLEQLKQSADIRSFNVITDKSDLESLLNVSAVFVKDNFIYVVVKLGENIHLPFNGTRLHLQVNTANILRVSTPCNSSEGSTGCTTKIPCHEDLSICGFDTVITIDASAIQQWLINDRTWNTGLFRMFAMPIDPTVLPDDVTTLIVGLYDNTREIRIGGAAVPKAFYRLDQQKNS
ncbi:MAG: hypothetical protein GC179_25935 [Anaerolineaceae bacterium]|nr:hypothetical protein [Anaerolineaceae bacterium]